jgi:hypothetical protein
MGIWAMNAQGLSENKEGLRRVDDIVIRTRMNGLSEMRMFLMSTFRGSVDYGGMKHSFRSHFRLQS